MKSSDKAKFNVSPAFNRNDWLMNENILQRIYGNFCNNEGGASVDNAD